MKIDQQNVSGAAESTTGVSQSSATSAASLDEAKAGRAASAGDSGDQADISSLSRAIQSFHSDGANNISQLSASVRSGSYNVDPALISRGIVNEALATTAAG